MQINGLKVNTQAISEGLYRIICQQGKESIVAFGMIPAEIMECLSKLLREKIISIAAAQNNCTIQELELTGWLDENKIKEICRPIEREVCAGIYAAAKNAGKMIV